MSPHLLSGAARLAGSSLLRLQSDERLVALVRDGHDPAYGAIVERYQAELLRYSTRIVGESRAEDVVQQSFLNAHMALRANDNAVQLRPWLYRIAHNTGLNVLRSSRRETQLDERLAAPGGVEHDLESRERLHEALVAIARLPEPQRDALTLQAIEGRSHAEIAAAIGVTPGAARQHLHRARTTVRAAVSAITPYGLIARLAMAGPEGGSVPIAATAGAGASATAAKIGAGLLAASAIGVGATHISVLHPAHHRASHVRHTAPAAEQAAVGDPSAPAAHDSSEHAVRAVLREGRHAGRHRGRGSGSEASHRSGDGSSHGGESHSGSGDGGGSEDIHRSSTSGSHDGGGSSGDGSSSSDGGGSSGTNGSSGDGGSSSGTSGSDGGSDGGGQFTTTTTSPTVTTTSSGSDGGSGSTDGGGSSDGGGGGSDDGTTSDGGSSGG